VKRHSRDINDALSERQHPTSNVVLLDCLSQGLLSQLRSARQWHERQIEQHINTTSQARKRKFYLPTSIHAPLT
jgi:adenosyl cobinamide kinase/adenosyl cobinamide phosphate guanylyltransferase